MKGLPSSRESDRPLDSSNRYRNLVSTLMAAAALNGAACSQMPQSLTPEPVKAPMSVNPMAPQSAEPKIQLDSLVFPTTFFGNEFKPTVWPDVPASCVFTGIILRFDHFSEPHKILLENMCLQKRDKLRNVFQGEHRWVEADAQGRYEIPFYNAHLEEKGKGLIFVTDVNGNRVEEDLDKDVYMPRTFSFERPLNDYRIRASE